MERKTSLYTTLHNLQLPFVLKNIQTSLVSFHTGRIIISPWFITGFADAEGCFSILIQYNVKYKTKWRVKAIFSIGRAWPPQIQKDIALLEEIQSTLGVGKIHKQGKDSVQYRVESIK